MKKQAERRIVQHVDAEGRKCWKIEHRDRSTGLWGEPGHPMTVYYSRAVAEDALRWLEKQEAEIEQAEQ